MKTIFRVNNLDNNERIDFNTKDEALNDINKKLNDGDINKDYMYTLEIIKVDDKGKEDCGTILIMLSVNEYKKLSFDDKQKVGLKY